VHVKRTSQSTTDTGTALLVYHENAIFVAAKTAIQPRAVRMESSSFAHNLTSHKSKGDKSIVTHNESNSIYQFIHMFRTTKKKPKPRTIRTSAEVDDDEEDTLSAAPTKILRKPNRTVVRSLEVEGGGKKKKRRTTGGLGFGGAPSSYNGEEEETGASEITIAKQKDLDQSTTASVSYGKEALSKLKSEQKFKARVAEDEEKGVAVSARVKDDGKLENSLPAYMPLDGNEQPSDEPTILTGEEAMSFNQKGTPPSIAQDLEEDIEMTHSHSNEVEDSSDWEAEVTRRAGIHQSAGNSTSSTFSSQPPRKVSIAHLRTNISSTLALLQKQREDLERALHLREAEALQTGVLPRLERNISILGRGSPGT
jgi:hypothetical protein